MSKYRIEVKMPNNEAFFCDTNYKKDVQQILDAFSSSMGEEITIFEKNKKGYSIIFKTHQRKIGF